MWVANGDWSRFRCSRVRGWSKIVEQALAGAEHDRGDRDRELLHVAGAQGLADDVRPAHDEHIPVSCGLARLGDGLVQPVHEGEAGVGGSVVGSVRHDEERRAERVVAAPGLGCLVGVAATDDGADSGEPCVEELLVHTCRLAAWGLAVAPRAAEDPVVQSLAAFAEAAAWSVVRPGDVAVE